MSKSLLLLIVLGLFTTAQIGCRACGSCYDYASPVAGAHCDHGCTACADGCCGDECCGECGDGCCGDCH